MAGIIFIFTLAFSVLVVALLALIAWRGLNGSSESDDAEENARPRGRPHASTSGALRQRARPNRNQIEEDQDESGPEIDMEEWQDDGVKAKIGVKKQRKLEMKAEKKLARERELEEREEKKKRMEELEKQRKMEEDKIEAEEKAKEEAERLEKERKEREEYEEYLKMKQSFAVEEEGYDGDVNEEESQNKLKAFIDYVKNQKVVHLDELAGNFNLRTQDVVQRLQDLLQQELLVGVIDDRGKFIYITNEELQSVAKFIKQRGRVSITDLAENSNTFINLTPVEASS